MDFNVVSAVVGARVSGVARGAVASAAPRVGQVAAVLRAGTPGCADETGAIRLPGGPADDAARLPRVVPDRVRGRSPDRIDLAIEAARRDPTVGLLVDRYRPYGDLTREQFDEGYWDSSARNGEGDWRYPDGDGAVPGTAVPRQLASGDVLDRFGPPHGARLSPVDSPLSSRSQPPANAFEQLGGGVEYRTDLLVDGQRVNVQWLTDHGYLEEL